MSTPNRQSRWYAKLKADPVRYAEFQAKTRAASRRTYLAQKLDPAKLERQRANRRRAAKKQWQKAKLDPVKLAYRRRYSNRRCVNLDDAYVAERLNLTAETCPPELLELKRTHLQLQRTISAKARLYGGRKMNDGPRIVQSLGLNPSDTPRTDAATIPCGWDTTHPVVKKEFAQKLEREIADLRVALAAMGAIAESNAAQEQAVKLANQIDEALAQRNVDLIISVSDRYDLDVAIESAKEALK